MANRVLLNSSGLKVSQPGVDVLTAANSQLQFSSDWSGLSLYTQGSHTLSWSVNGNIGWTSAWLSFGKTFSTPPSVWFFQDKGSYLVPLGSAYGVVYHISDGFGSTIRSFYVSATVLTNGIDLRAFYNKQTDGWIQPQMTIRYFVFEYNL